jgi:hemerythrin superfamily protein
MSKEQTSKEVDKALHIADVGRSFSEKEIKTFVIKLRKKHRSIEEKQFFCNNHNFKLEAEAKRSEAEIVRRIIHEMENEFDLGFVWGDSLNY